ncbi:thioredoxin domain-containing 9-like protein [Chlorella sorokiniana]|uniref:Thioredoxin domain-containing 9-like protein n=1 Tax=Chlorella sorokiniana TaxID=3076 RepID=A0A2P6U189_CHLSO|nr:thioredoxin domain-containing 9-like protein [Chlorella sorokiniana]|eukprot:PRW60072.1 thioredoxin domain-containing 9-like protein [Chlorella sorokiniana]
MEDPCCAPEAAAWAADAEACDALACDPTLEACCRRDLEAQAVEARLKAQLSLADRSKERQRLAARVLGTPAQQQQQQQQQAGELGSDLESEEDEELMGRMRAQRLAQLQQAAEARARLQAAGHGGLVDVPEARLLREAEASTCPLVCHLAFEGSPLDDELDEHLAQLAHRYLGTRFVRARISLRSTLHLRLRTPPGPGLLCFRDGSLVAAAGLDCFGAPDCLLEETVDKWLRQHKGVLLESAAPAAARRGSDGAGSSGDNSGSGSEEEGDEWQQPCEVCGRRYPHQHIRSVYASRPEDGSSSEGEDT